LFERKNTIKKKYTRNSKLLIICHENHFETVKTSITSRITGTNTVTLWNLDEKKVLDATNHPVKREKYTDIIFCYPDISFEQMLLLMDRTTDKSITHHIYHLNRELFISPNY